jgi:hypothetical protein
MARCEAVAPIFVPGSFVNVFAKGQAFGASYYSAFVLAHDLPVPNIKIKSVEQESQPKLYYLHNWEFDLIIISKGGADFLGKIP